MGDLCISSQHIQQVINALSEANKGGKLAYGFFVTGCVDLVDDKLDHMLWKVFAMVDEDHSGDINTEVFQHFLQSAVDRRETDGNSCDDHGQMDIERYLCNVLGSQLSPKEIVEKICR